MPKLDWWNSYQLERKAAEILHKQVQDGWYFDKAKCLDNIDYLTSEMNSLYDLVRPTLSYVVKNPYTVPISKPWKMNGDLSTNCINYCKESGLDPVSILGPFSRVIFDEPSLSSSDQVKNQLIKLGWVPKQFNYQKKDGKIIYDSSGEPIPTSPKLDKDSYDDLPEELGNIRTWLVYSKRLEQHRTFIEGLREDGTIPSNLDSLGAVSGRCTHRKPITNVPRVNTLFGKESRELFLPHPGYLLVGEDRSQIEARLIAHVSILILGHSKLADVIMGRDFHEAMFEALEGLVTSRQAAKTPRHIWGFKTL